MTVEKTILDYLEDANPTLLGHAAEPAKLKMRRVLDSIGMLSFLMFLEQTFGIRIRDQDVVAENFDTVSTTISYIEKRVDKT